MTGYTTICFWLNLMECPKEAAKRRALMARLFALDAEILDAVEQSNAQLLIQVLIKAAVGQRLFQQQRPVKLHDLYNCSFPAAFGLEQQILEIHDLPPPNSFRSF